MIGIGLAGAFLGGLLTLLSPCSAVLLPSFFAYAFGGRATILARTGVFYLGLAVTLVPLGVAASTIGAFFNTHRDVLVLLMSMLVIILGLLQLFGVSFGLLRRRSRGPARDGGTGVLAIFSLGAVYGVAGVCSGPILGSVLAVAGIGGNPTYGGVLLAVYALGMVVPLAVLAVFWEQLGMSGRRWFVPRSVTLGPLRTTTTGLLSGTVLVALGILLLLSGGTANLGGVLGVDDQFTVEQWATSISDRVSDAVVLIVVTTVVICAFIARRWWSSSEQPHR